MESMSEIANHGAARPGAKTLAGVIERLDRIENLLANKVTDKPLSLREAAAYLGLAVSTVYKMTSSGAVRFSKPNGKRVFFAKADLDKYLAKNPITPIDEIESLAVAHVAGGKQAGR